MKNKSWFEASKEGLRELQEGKPKHFIARELIQNAYVAGLVDGEGCVSIKKMKSGYFGLRVALGLSGKSKPEVFDLLISQYGGALEKKYQDKRENRLPHWLWVIATKQAENFLKQIYPFSILKREQIKLALQYRKIVKLGNKRDIKGQERYYLKLKSLKNYNEK